MMNKEEINLAVAKNHHRDALKALDEVGVKQVKAAKLVSTLQAEVWKRAEGLWGDYIEAMREVLVLGSTGHGRYSWADISEHLNHLTPSAYQELNGEGAGKTNAGREKVRQRYADLIAPVSVARS